MQTEHIATGMPSIFRFDRMNRGMNGEQELKVARFIETHFGLK